MIEKRIVFNATTGETTIEEVEVEEILEHEKLLPEPTIEERVELLEDENKKIKENNTTQDILIDTTMMATDEVFMMLEPILEMIPQTMSLERSVSKMVDMYVAMVQRRLKTIEKVPVRYREEVTEILAKLEKELIKVIFEN
ncbi:MAG: CD1375 family protein [Clostridium celatum]|nr:CD1375 family protein [Clostridium celatum]